MTNFAEMNKSELRAACKAAGISYGKLTVGGMRDTLAAQAQRLTDEMTASEALAQDLSDAPEVDLPTLSVYGLGSDDDSAKCPHCGTNHFHNGYQTAESLSGDRVKHGLTSEYVCLGCNGEWGPLVQRTASKPTANPGTGLKIEKNREVRNGVKRPSAGGKCRAVWDALDELQAELEAGESVTAKMVKDLAADEGWNANNASIEFYNWRKFNGVTGRSK